MYFIQTLDYVLFHTPSRFTVIITYRTVGSQAYLPTHLSRIKIKPP
jgi:hypothetical protein